MGEKEREFRKEIAQQNTTGFSGLLGRFTKEEQEFIKKVKGNKKEKQESKYDFLPTEEEMDNYINQSLKALFGEEETR